MSQAATRARPNALSDGIVYEPGFCCVDSTVSNLDCKRAVCVLDEPNWEVVQRCAQIAAQVHDLQRRGKNVLQIMAELGLSRRTVFRYLARA